jgi:hypothetical protein
MLDQTTSRSTLYAAFDRVRENGGCRGSDGVSLADFHDRLEGEIDHLQDRNPAHGRPLPDRAAIDRP